MNSNLKFSLLAGLTVLLAASTAVEAKMVVKAGKPTKVLAHEAPGKALPMYVNVFFRDKKGSHFLDPVCNKYGIASDSGFVSDIAGKAYCFDSKACKEMFDKNSSKYLAKFSMPAKVSSIKGQTLTVHDPVNSAKVEVSDKTIFTDFSAKRYYFSADSSRKAFEKDPSKFTAKKSKTINASEKDKAGKNSGSK